MIKHVKPPPDLKTYERTVQVIVSGVTRVTVPLNSQGASGYRTDDGDEWARTASLEITIDIPAIVRELGKNALSNRTGKSRDGHVTVKRLSGAIQ